MNPLRQALVVGAGTMGCGIAEVLVRAGFATFLADQDKGVAEQGCHRLAASLTRAREKGKLSAEAAQAAMDLLQSGELNDYQGSPELIVEAVFEDLWLKKSLMAQLSERFPDAPVLASNTSSLSLTEMAAATQRPDRVVGLHFFNPAPVMELLEVVRAEQTSPETLNRALQLANDLAKSPIVVQDVAGFATSRLGVSLGLEAIRMVESGVASAVDIDRAMELGYRHPMGPLKLTDLVGLDVRLAIAEHLCREIGPQFTPPPLLRRLVRAGHLGKKTGRGFYRWSGSTPEPL